MNPTDQEKIKRFLADKVMSNAVRVVLENAIKKPSKDRDVHILASRFLAFEILETAWKELEKYGKNEESEEKQLRQVGL